MDFSLARYYMVERSIRPWSVTEPSLLAALNQIPREKFFPQDQQDLVYAEITLPLANGGMAVEPRYMARLIQALNLDASKNVLEIGTGSGYATAVLARLAQHVDTLDIDEQQITQAQNILRTLEFNNISYYKGDGFNQEVYAKVKNNYDAIYFGGAIHTLPAFVFDALKIDGLLIAVLGNITPNQAIRYRKHSDGSISSETLFEMQLPFLTQTNRLPLPFEF